ncbi:MAG: hypothetical protein JJU00_07010 [Opitutales bacterium]|nr:hypothetical protein [Opitutales bacterium]
MKKTPIPKSRTLWKGVCLALFAGIGSTLAAEPTVFDNEGISFSPGHFPVWDGWTIDNADRAKVVVEDFGLTYDVADGRRIEGGIRSISLIGSPDPKMDNWLTLPVEAPEADGSMFFSIVFHPHSVGTEADPDQFFLRLGGWSAFTAVKLRENELEVTGNNVPIAPGSELEDREALTGMNHLLVGELVVDGDGTVTTMNVWLNPSADDSGSPTHSVSLNVDAESVTFVDMRSQNTRTTIDNLTLGSSFSDVVPPLPEDPGDITLTLPSDANEAEPGIQVSGGTLFVEVDGEPYVADTVLPVGTVVTYRAVPNQDWELTGWNGTTLTGEEIEVPVYSATNISPVFEFGDVRVTLKWGHGARPRLQLQNQDGGWGNTNRTIFDNGEVIRVVGDGLPFFVFNHWRGDLEPLNNNLDPDNPDRITSGLTVGGGLLSDDIVVEATAYFSVREFVRHGTAGTIGLDGIDYDFTEAGVPGTIPAAEMSQILAEKYAAGVGGAVNWSLPLEYSGLVVDPTVDFSTPQPPGFIRYDFTGAVVDSNLPHFRDIHVDVGGRTVLVRQGPRNRVEAGGAGNRSTADGPGTISINESISLMGDVFRPLEIALNAGGRQATSGPGSLGGATSWDLEFDADDKVVMAGLVYLNRTDWQFFNADGAVRLWADAVYDDGSTSTQLSSPNMHNVLGEHNHFLGFSAPEGRYITNIRVLHQGGNNRSFTNLDDLVIILEGDPDATYALDVSAEGGSVEVSPEGPYNEGDTVTLTATGADPGQLFVGWAHASSPDNLISTATSVDLTVRSNMEIVALFEDAPEADPVLVLDSEAISFSPGHFPVWDGWMIDDTDRAKVVVQDFGLHYDVVGGRRIDGGIRSILLDGGVNVGDEINSMDNWLTLPVSMDGSEDSIFFSVVFNAETVGTEADPAELFIRLAGWNVYFAVKVYDGILELPGGNTLDFADTGTEALAGVNHLLVGEVQSAPDGSITGLNAWLNPTATDRTPMLSASLGGGTNVSDIEYVEVRSQKVPMVMDNLVFGFGWQDVVPLLPQDPGDITLTLPDDGNEAEPGIQVSGGTLFVEVDGDPYVADTVLPIGTVVTYRAVPDSGTEFIRWNGTNLTGMEIEVPVYSNTNISPVFEFGDIRVEVRHGHGARPRLQLQNQEGGWSNTNRTLFDNGEVIRVVGDGLPFFSFNHWRGDLEDLNDPVDLDNTDHISPGLTVGGGLLSSDIVVEATAYLNVREFARFAVEGEMDLDYTQFDFTEAGMPGTASAATMAEAVSSRFDRGLGGVVTFNNPLEFSGLFIDPTVDFSTPAPEGFIEYDAEGEVTDSRIPNFRNMHIDIGDRTVLVRQGARNYAEAGGAGNRATADGPGVESINESLSFMGETFRPLTLLVNPGGRQPASPPAVLNAPSSWDLEFDADDKVVMAGITFLPTNNWQFYNADGAVRIWADAVYDDGSTSTQLSSPNLRDSGGEHNHFAGFQAPEGRYITNIRLWVQGGNNRAFGSADNLVVILEDDEAEAVYEVEVTVEGSGSVSASPEGPYADGDTVMLTAVPDAGNRLAMWTDTTTGAVLGMSSTLDLVVRANLGITATFTDDGFRAALESALGGTVTVLSEEDGLYSSNWLGTFEAMADDLPWVYTEDHGWLYVYAAEDGAAASAMGWHYDIEVGFIYAIEANYPDIWTAGDETWFHFFMEYNDPRLFYAYEDEDFIFVPRSGD